MEKFLRIFKNLVPVLILLFMVFSAQLFAGDVGRVFNKPMHFVSLDSADMYADTLIDGDTTIAYAMLSNSENGEIVIAVGAYIYTVDINAQDTVVAVFYGAPGPIDSIDQDIWIEVHRDTISVADQDIITWFTGDISNDYDNEAKYYKAAIIQLASAAATDCVAVTGQWAYKVARLPSKY